MNARAISLPVLAMLLSAAPQAPRAEVAQSTVVSTVYAAYVEGRLGEIERTFATTDDFRRARSEIFQAARDWRATWKPSCAAFLFDLAVVGFGRGWTDAPLLLAAARDMVVTRRPAPGDLAGRDDVFEVTLHRAAVALLLANQRPETALEYLAPLAKRISGDNPTGVTDVRLLAPRIAVLTGSVLEYQSAPFNRRDPRAPEAAASMRIDPADTEARRLAEQALAAYQRAGRESEAAGEAAVRRGFLLHRLRRDGDALDELARANGAADPVVVYWATLVRGRIHDTAGRAADAAAAYEEAARLQPRAQTPLIALAALWQRHDQPAAALRWAVAAKAAGVAVDADPWRDYWLADARLLVSLAATLRGARP